MRGVTRTDWRSPVAWLAVCCMSLLGLAAGRATAQTDSAWAECTYQWEKLTVVVRTDAGIYSPALQTLGMASNVGPPATRPA